MRTIFFRLPRLAILTMMVILIGGIGAMFSLGRADILPQGDLALQEAAKILFDLPQRPKPKQLADMAQDWSPWRSVAARILFSYYRVAKQREGIS
jgi:DNA-3-methyladenine glycosylase II